MPRASSGAVVCSCDVLQDTDSPANTQARRQYVVFADGPLVGPAGSVANFSLRHSVRVHHVLLQVPVLVDTYGSRLPELLDTHHSLRLSVTGGDAARQDKAQ